MGIFWISEINLKQQFRWFFLSKNVVYFLTYYRAITLTANCRWPQKIWSIGFDIEPTFNLNIFWISANKMKCAENWEIFAGLFITNHGIYFSTVNEY